MTTAQSGEPEVGGGGCCESKTRDEGRQKPALTRKKPLLLMPHTHL